MQLSTYIKDLLYRYECVIIPGFGAFLTQNHTARIDEASNTFYPPGKTLSFNRQLQTNDGLLANYISSAENCSYELALQKIRNFTGRLSLDLSEGKTVTIKNIGDFALSQERTLQFTPIANQNFSAASFGLSALVVPEVERITAVETTTQKTVVLHQEKKKTAYPFMRYAAIGLLAISLGGFTGLKMYEGEVAQHNFEEKRKSDVLVEHQIQEATFVMSNTLPALNLTIEKETGRYHIVAGAFRVEQNAQKKITQLAQKGYSARLIGKNKYGLHQVVYSSHSDRLEALKTLRTIKRQENRDAWLLVQQLNK